MNIKLSSATSTFNRGLGTVILEGSHLFLRAQHLEGAGEILFDSHHGSTVVELSTIVGGREDSDYVSFVRPVVAVHHKLVSASDSGQSV